MDPSRNSPPVAVRVMRPFPTEDALLAVEASAFTRTGVVLIGAPSRPNGVVIRFEICLQDGAVAMRGEGRVVGYRPPSSEEEGALMLRFTRLDVKSKGLLDRAVVMREERKSLVPPAPPRRPTSRPPPPPTPPPSVAPSTERDAQEDDDGDDAMDVDDADLTSADDDDLTVQQPPVVMMAEMAAALPREIPREKAPVPQPSPVDPTPHPVAPPAHAPPQQAPEPPQEHTPQKEKMPIPQRSPGSSRSAAELVARARGERGGEFRPSLEPGQRDSALDRLRKRSSKV